MKCACCDLELRELANYEVGTSGGRVVLRNKRSLLTSQLPLHTYLCPCCGSVKLYVDRSHIKELISE